MNTTRLVAASLLALAALIGNSALAGDGCCAGCGCHDGCEKVCRLEVGEKKVKVTCWGCKCEDFCLPGKSDRLCKNEEMVCDGDCDCDCDEVVTKGKKFVWFDYEALGCGKLATKKKLMKKEVSVTVPSYKWVVEDLCAGCQASCQVAAAPANEKLPSLPAGAEQAKLLYVPAGPIVQTSAVEAR